MFLSIREMEQRELVFDVTYPPGEIEFFESNLWQAGPLSARGSAELIETTEEIRVRGRLEVAMEASCDRCLETAAFPIQTDFNLLYRPALSVLTGEELELRGEEIEVEYYRGDGLELKNIFREQVLLALPMQRICSESCKGICPVCGQNRNERDCGCRQSQIDDRWAGLRNL